MKQDKKEKERRADVWVHWKEKQEWQQELVYKITFFHLRIPNPVLI